MKLTRNINLHGVVLTIDEDAYQLLKDYLSDIESRLPADEQKDVMDDVESRIAELLQSALFAQKGQRRAFWRRAQSAMTRAARNA